MSEKVVSLAAKREEKQPHIEGPAICGGCKHTWQAVAPKKTENLECPSCGSFRGLWKYNIAPEYPVLQCPSCEGSVFMVSETGVFCIGCGTADSFKTILGD